MEATPQSPGIPAGPLEDRLIGPGYTSATVTDKISSVVLARTPRWWYAAFGASFLLVMMLFHSLAYLVTKGVGVFGVNVPVMVMLTYAVGAGLAALAGVLAAPVIQITPLMGSNLIIVVFAVVVIGGMGSILGSIVTGFALGIVEGLTKVFYPEASNTVIFVIMALVLLVRPTGLFGRDK